jgi:AraC-like DNA-binding protein
MSQTGRYRHVQVGLNTHPRGFVSPRHWHWEGHAEIVLAGSVVESTFAGRLFAEPGDVLLHGPFDSHTVAVSATHDTTRLELPWLDGSTEGRFRVEDPDFLVRVAERDPAEAMALLAEQLLPPKTRDPDWIDLLFRDMRQDTSLPLQRWAEEQRMRPEAISRGFRSEFGVTPKRFRLEMRVRMAWAEVVRTTRSVTQIALDHGFADLAHMSRNVREITGYTPSVWRSAAPDPRSRKSLQARRLHC